MAESLTDRLKEYADLIQLDTEMPYTTATEIKELMDEAVAEVARLTRELAEAREIPHTERCSDAILNRVVQERDDSIQRGVKALNQAAKQVRGWVAHSRRYRVRFEQAESEVAELRAALKETMQAAIALNAELREVAVLSGTSPHVLNMRLEVLDARDKHLAERTRAALGE